MSTVLNHYLEVSASGAMKTASLHTVFRANFPGNTLDSTIWTETSVNGGSVSVNNGVARMNTSTAINGGTKIVSIEQGQFECGQASVFQGGVRPAIARAGLTQRWGLITADEQEGLFFEYDGTSFNVVSLKGGVRTVVNNSAFDGTLNYAPVAEENAVFRIQYGPHIAIFGVYTSQGHIKPIHTMTRTDFPLTDDFDMGLYYEIFNNGIEIDSELRLQGAHASIFGNLPTVRANGVENVTDATVMTPTKSVIVGRDSGGTYRNITTNSGGSLSTTDFFFEVGRGIVPNHLAEVKFGHNPDVDTGAPEDIWHGGGEYTGQPNSGSPETLEIFSSDAADDATPGGTGARTIRFFGLRTSASTAYTSEDVTLNGMASVLTTTTWYRVNRAYVLTAGSGGANAGNITIRHSTTTANVFVVMGIGDNQSTVAAWTVPAGFTAYIVTYSVEMTRANGNAGAGEISVRLREPGGVYRAIRYHGISTAYAVKERLETGLQMIAGSDVKFRVDAVTDSNSLFSATFTIIYVAN